MALPACHTLMHQNSVHALLAQRLLNICGLRYNLPATHYVGQTFGLKLQVASPLDQATPPCEQRAGSTGAHAQVSPTPFPSQLVQTHMDSVQCRLCHVLNLFSSRSCQLEADRCYIIMLSNSSLQLCIPHYCFLSLGVAVSCNRSLNQQLPA